MIWIKCQICKLEVISLYSCANVECFVICAGSYNACSVFCNFFKKCFNVDVISDHMMKKPTMTIVL